MRRGLKSILIFVAFAAIYTLSRHAVIGGNSTTTTTQASSMTTTTMSVPAGPACEGSDFRGAFNQGQGAAGTISSSITLTKSTSGNCTLNGWPILILQDKTGSIVKSTLVDVSTNGPIQFPDANANEAPTAVNLTQNSKATFSFAYSDVPTGSQKTCPVAYVIGVQIQKGGSVASVNSTYGIGPCNNGQLWVSPFY